MGWFDDTTTTTSTGPQDWLKPYWQQYVGNISGMTQNPLPVYQGQTVADWNPYQQTALGMSSQLAQNGTPAYNAATSQIATQAGGVSNPYATQGNAYKGNNPHLQSMIDSSNADIARAYSTGTAAQTDAAAARAGSFGGSGYQEQVGMNQDMLGKTLANNTAGLRYNNYLNSGQLEGQDLNRATQGFQADQQNALNASQLGLASQGTDLAAINNLYQQGGGYQNQQQNVLNAAQNYFSQTQQAPFSSQQIFGNALSQANGGFGTSTNTQPGASWLNGLGGILAGLGIFGGG